MDPLLDNMERKSHPQDAGGISNPSKVLFERALRGLDSESAETALIELANSPLPTLERDRRICLVTRQAAFTPEQVASLVAGLPASRLSVLNAIRAALPEGLRPFANPAHGVALVSPRPGIDPEESRTPAFTNSEGGGRYRAVVLVGNQTEHTHNRALLERHSQLQPLRIPTPAGLMSIAGTGICGIVVASSVWHGQKVEEQVALVKQILEFSTFSYLKLVTKGMHDAVEADLQTIARTARCGPIDCFRLNLATSPDIRSSDLQSFLSAAKVLRIAECSTFRSLDLNEDESTLLRLIGTIDESATGEGYGAKRLYGGRTAAKVFLLETTQGKRVVVKFNESSVLCKEMERYQGCIQNWDDATNPVFHRHLSACAIVYRLQSKPGRLADPAPTLQSALQKLVASEWHEDKKPCEEQGENLGVTIGHAIGKLVELNKKKARTVGDEFWLHWPPLSLARNGVSVLGASRAHPTSCLFQKVRAAEAQVARLNQTAYVHGDINGGNVLVIDRVPVFIDFECSGPGNPFVDLVRLDAVVRLHAMRVILPEAELTALYRELYVAWASFDELLIRFPAMTASTGCKLSLQTAVATRDAAAEISVTHGANRLDYVATVAIVAAYSLSVLSPGSGVERACLAAALEPLSTEQAKEQGGAQ